MNPVPSQPAAAGFILGHRPALDGLRGLAVLAVIAHHTGWLSGGFIGVDVFFVLSGFLITTLLLQEHQRTGHISLPRFYLRRCLRLLPALLGLLAVAWLWVLLWGPRWQLALLRKDFPAVLLYYFNWRLVFTWKALHAPHLYHLWSLSVEEQFYLLWPAALVVLLRRGSRRRWLLALVLAGLVGPAVLRLAYLHAHCDPRQPMWFWRLYGASDMRADALSAGCLVGLLAVWGMLPVARWSRRSLAAAGWLGAASLAAHFLRCTPNTSLYMYRWGFTLAALSAAVLVAALMASPRWLLARLLEVRPLGWVGRISYGAYLWHFPVLMALARRPEDLMWPRVLVLWGAILAAGALSHYCVEKPFLRLKQRLEARPAAGPRNATEGAPYQPRQAA